MSIQMIALKDFRMAQDGTVVWVRKGEPYSVDTEKEANRHERGRGKRKSPKPDEQPAKPGKAKGA